VRTAADTVAQWIRERADARTGEVKVLGPTPSPIAKIRGRSRMQMLLRSRDRRALRRLISELVHQLAETPPSAVRVGVDIDPVQML
jgi:primosomal protein N' (replication factor Y)